MRKLLSRWLPVFLWAAIIFILSSNSNPYGQIPEWLYHWLWWTKLFGQSLFFYLGGLSHFLEYAILSFLLARAILCQGDSTRGQLFTVFYLILLYAYTDEFHQVFVPGRAFQVVDLLLDALGTLIGLGVYILWIKRATIKQSNVFKRFQDIPSRLRELITKPT
ncbi:VanZ family protein [bacterium]|nr:VanZ family protein [bacterium]